MSQRPDLDERRARRRTRTRRSTCSRTRCTTARACSRACARTRRRTAGRRSSATATTSTGCSARAGALPHGDPVLQGRDPRRDVRDDHPQRPEVLLHPAAGLPRRGPDGPVPARLPGRGDHRGLGVGRLPRRGGQAQRRPREGLELAADPVRRADPDAPRPAAST